jgi:glycerol uptake facilitator protein
MQNNRLVAELIAEALGTGLLVLFGTGVVAMVVLFGHGTAGEVVNGGYTNITLAWGLGVAMAVYLTAKVSGAHLNPAVTLALAVFRGFPWRKVVPYSLAQTVGAFAGAALTYMNYRAAFHQVDPDLSRTQRVFATFPAFPDLPMTGFFDQVLGTALLLLLIFAFTDERNLTPPSWLGPLLVGLVVIVIGMSFGSLHGYAINPARDFGPRVLLMLLGFQHDGLTDGTGQFLVPLLGPLVGGVLGAAVYDVAIGRYLKSAAEPIELTVTRE